MPDTPPIVRLAAVQAAPAFFDRDGGVDEVRRLIGEAASGGARLIVFPEALIPGYPWGLRFGTAVGGRTEAGRRVFERYWSNAVDVPGPATEAIGEAAAEASAYVAIGVVERDTTYSQGTLYCTLLYFGPDGDLLAKHRKLKPTAAERLIWGEGDGSTLPVLDTEHGRIGGLICWENYMPLARMAMYAKGLDIYLAPTADARDTWQATLRHIAMEGRCFVIGCNSVIRKADYPRDLEARADLEDSELLPEELMNRGGTAIVGPLGSYLAGPLFGEEGILYADLDLSELPRARFDFDVVGHYARPDVFQLIVNALPAPPVRSVEGE